LRQLRFSAESWPIAGTFTIARGSKTAANVVVVTLTENGISGRGEAVPYPRYDETVPQVLAALEQARPEIEAGHWPDMPKAAQNAVDCAIWDLKAKQQQKPAWALANLAKPTPVITAFTLSLDTPEAMANAAAAAAGRPLLKLKLGREGDVERLKAIRARVPAARLIVDANEGWAADNLAEMLAACKTYNVELVEQPLPASADEALRHMPRQTIICADESAHGRKTLHDLKGKYDAINIKLDKTGGLTEALALAHAAKAQDFKIMVGCMLATSLAMAPAFLLAQLVDYVDLDGPLLLARDREPGFTFEGSLMFPPPHSLWG
jgi:L-Ala-D/L-Glu epimerase